MNDSELIDQVTDWILISIKGQLPYEFHAKVIIDLVRDQDMESRWISVESHLPRKNGKYDVWLFDRRETDQWFNGKVFTNPNITYWQSPTKPPEDK